MAAPGHRAPDARLDLASAGIGATLRIVEARLEEAEAAWLSAVGLQPGEEVVVLRRAIASGPLHVRTASGGEFAVASELAAKLDVVAVVREGGS